MFLCIFIYLFIYRERICVSVLRLRLPYWSHELSDMGSLDSSIGARFHIRRKLSTEELQHLEPRAFFSKKTTEKRKFRKFKKVETCWNFQKRTTERKRFKARGLQTTSPRASLGGLGSSAECGSSLSLALTRKQQEEPSLSPLSWLQRSNYHGKKKSIRYITVHCLIIYISKL